MFHVRRSKGGDVRDGEREGGSVSKGDLSILRFGALFNHSAILCFFVNFWGDFKLNYTGNF